MNANRKRTLHAAPSALATHVWERGEHFVTAALARGARPETLAAYAGGDLTAVTGKLIGKLMGASVSHRRWTYAHRS